VGETRNVYRSLVAKRKEWQPRMLMHRWEGKVAPGHTGSGGIAPLILILALDGGEWLT